MTFDYRKGTMTITTFGTIDGRKASIEYRITY